MEDLEWPWQAPAVTDVLIIQDIAQLGILRVPSARALVLPIAKVVGQRGAGRERAYFEPIAK
jgi:hypothetical protein